MNSQHDDSAHRMAHGYGRMMERAIRLLEHAREDAVPRMRELIDHGVEKAVELEELTAEEAEKLGDYLHRDIQDAAVFLSYTGKSLGDWLNFDLELAEARFMEIFSSVVDHTRLELAELAERARRSDELHTGEITSPGTLECTQCGSKLHFREAGHIPPCGKCRGTAFRRATG